MYAFKRFCLKQKGVVFYLLLMYPRACHIVDRVQGIMAGSFEAWSPDANRVLSSIRGHNDSVVPIHRHNTTIGETVRTPFTL
jgi:hypothetical protein